jgi:hypothetical protein
MWHACYLRASVAGELPKSEVEGNAFGVSGSVPDEDIFSGGSSADWKSLLLNMMVEGVDVGCMLRVFGKARKDAKSSMGICRRVMILLP